MEGINLKGKLYDFIRNTPSIVFVPVSSDTVECRLESSNFTWRISNNDFFTSVQYDAEGWNCRRKPRKGEIPFVRISNDGKRENIYILARDLIIHSFNIGNIGFCEGTFYNDNFYEGEIGTLTHAAEETLSYEPDAFFEVDFFQESKAYWNLDDVKTLEAAGFKVSIVETE